MTNFSLPGFVDDAEVEVPRNLVVSVDGAGKVGKTDFGLRTTPEPVLYLPTEPGWEPTLARVLAANPKRRIIRPEKGKAYTFNPNNHPENDVRRKAREVWRPLRKAFVTAVRPGSGIGTVFLDTGSIGWKICLWSYQGLATKVGSWESIGQRGLANADWSSMIQAALEGTTAVVISHRLREEYKKSRSGSMEERTGRLVRDAQKDVTYDINISVLLERDDRGRLATIGEDCRYSPKLAGLELRKKDCSYAGLYRAVFGEELE